MGISEHNIEAQFAALAEMLSGQGVEVEEVKAKLKAQEIETPSWGYGNSGTRFGVFKQPGAARDVHERLSDAAQVHKMTGVCPSVALHIPWDKVDDYDALRQEATELGVCIGAINPNVFQEPEYKLGSFGHRDPAVRRKALDHMHECVDCYAADRVYSPEPFGLPTVRTTRGQDDIIERKRRFEECLRETHEVLPEGTRMLIEYKFFEPAFYHTDIADWGMALNFAIKAGPKAEVLVDLGHHPLSTNIEHLVALLLDEGRMGGFHFNNRKYADDDVTTGSVNLYEVFLIYHEILNAERRGSAAANIAYMIDQSHIIKPKVEAMIQSLVNIQTAYARALLVDRTALAEAQAEDDVVAGEEILRNAYDTDVRPLLALVRQDLGAEADPLGAYRRSGYFERIAIERQGELKGAASWG